MANVSIRCDRIAPAVEARVAELEADIVQYREGCIRDYMGEDYKVYVSGWFWWKTYRLRTRAEAEQKYETGYFSPPVVITNEDFWFCSRAKRGEDRFRSNIHKAERIAAAAEQANSAYIILDDEEVAFLRLARG